MKHFMVILNDCVALGRTFVVTDIHGNVLSKTDANGNTTTYEYDAQHRPIKITYPNNTTNTYTYDIINNIIDVTDARGTKMRYKYDP